MCVCVGGGGGRGGGGNAMHPSVHFPVIVRLTLFTNQTIFCYYSLAKEMRFLSNFVIEEGGLCLIG